MKNKSLELLDVKIDWIKLIDLALKRKDWGKVYNLYNYGDVSIAIEMESFLFSQNIARFYLKCNYFEDKYYRRWDNYTYIDFYINNYTLEFFNLVLLKKIKTLIEKIIKERTMRFAEELHVDKKYSILSINEDKIKEMGFISDYKKLLSLEINEETKESLIESFKEQIRYDLNEDYRNAVNFVVDSQKYCSSNMLNFLSLINSKLKF